MRAYCLKKQLTFILLCCMLALVEYKAVSGKTLQESIEKEMSGRLEDILVAIGNI